jgi:hypothetical protein
MMTKEQLELEFGRLLVEKHLAFTSNLNPFDMFVMGYEFSQQRLMSKLHLVDVSDSQKPLDEEISSALNDFSKIQGTKEPKKNRFD